MYIYGKNVHHVRLEIHAKFSNSVYQTILLDRIGKGLLRKDKLY